VATRVLNLSPGDAVVNAVVLIGVLALGIYLFVGTKPTKGKK
jgi:hypothetical protein